MAFEKTINLTGTEVCVKINGKNCDVRNDSNATVYVSRYGGIAPDADEVLSVPAGQAVKYCGLLGAVYLLGTGKVQICGNNNSSPVFKYAAAPSGVGGVSGETLNIQNSAEFPLLGLNLYGKSTQDGTPSPTNPVPIVSVGDDGELSVTSCGKNLLSLPYKGVVQNGNGISYTVNEDGSVTANGTATSDSYFDLNVRVKHWNHFGTLILTGCPAGGNSSNGFSLFMQTTDYSRVFFDVGKGITVDLNSAKLYNVGIAIRSGTTVENLTFYPMLRLASETDDTYEPYTGSTVALTSALPLCGLPVESGGNYTDSNGQQWVCDEVIYNADGTGKVVKRFAVETLSDLASVLSASAVDTNGGLAFRKKLSYVSVIQDNKTVAKMWCSHISKIRSAQLIYSSPTADAECGIGIGDSDKYISVRMNGFNTIADINAFLAESPMTIVYEIVPEEIELTAEEMAQIEQLYSYNGVTNVFNDEGAEMSVKYCNSPLISEYYLPMVKAAQSSDNG